MKLSVILSKAVKNRSALFKISWGFKISSHSDFKKPLIFKIKEK